MVNKVVSIIIPVYNAEKYLDECLATIIKQTYSLLEVILVNDGSTDLSGKICNHWAEVDERIRVIHCENQGVSAARNEGLRHVSGDYIIFVDADDWIELDMVEKMVDTIEQSGSDAVFCGYYEEVIEEDKRECYPLKARCATVDKNTALFNILEEGQYHTVLWNKMFRYDVICGDTMITMDETLTCGEDMLFCCNVLERCTRVSLIDSNLYHWRIREQSACHTKGVSRQRLDEITAAYKVVHVCDVFSKEVSEVARERLYRRGFNTVCEVYISDNKELFKELYNIIVLGRMSWWKISHMPLKRKIKRMVIDLAMQINLPSKMIEDVYKGR